MTAIPDGADTSISLIQIMGLIGENCGPCSEAAEDPNGGGLAGSWWRAWARANDASGYVGAAIGEYGVDLVCLPSVSLVAASVSRFGCCFGAFSGLASVFGFGAR